MGNEMAGSAGDEDGVYETDGHAKQAATIGSTTEIIPASLASCAVPRRKFRPPSKSKASQSIALPRNNEHGPCVEQRDGSRDIPARDHFSGREFRREKSPWSPVKTGDAYTKKDCASITTERKYFRVSNT